MLLRFFDYAVLEKKSISIATHGLGVAVDETADLVEELAVGPDQVEVIYELLNCSVWRALKPAWKRVLTTDLQFKCLQIHRLLYYLRIIRNI